MKSFKLIVLAIPAALLLIITSCNQTGESRKSDDSTAVSAAGAPAIESDTTEQVYSNYIALKNDLVASDPVKAKAAGEKLAQSLKKIEGCENTAALASTLASTSDLAAQRTVFTALSADIIALMKHAPLNSGKFFVQHCPMANENEGGYWLSSEEEIRNPYYGDEMLECGSVTETIAAK